MSVTWKLRVVAGSPDGYTGTDDGPASEATFMAPRGIALSPDESLLYVADYGSYALRYVDLDNEVVGTRYGLGTSQPRNISIDPSGCAIVTTDSTLLWFPSISDDVAEEHSLTGLPGVLGVTMDPGATTATVKSYANDDEYGWYTTSTLDGERFTLERPPTLPTPPFCDPPTNSIPVTAVRVTDNPGGQWWYDSGMARVGPLVVGFCNIGGQVAVKVWDQWGQTSFPAPYVTCDVPDHEPAVSAVTTDSYVPWQACRGPDDPDTGLPTVVGAAWGSSNGIILRAVVDADAQTVQLDYSLSMGITNQLVTGIAYSATRDRFYFSTADFRYFGNELPQNSIVELVSVHELHPTYSGGQVAIGPGLGVSTDA